jgi:hypothetical protein
MNNHYNNIYKYSQNLNLKSFVDKKNDENNINSKDPTLLNQKVSFLRDLANILENKLKNNIRLHQKGFEIYKQKIISDKDLILNTISNELKNLKINQLLLILKQIKEDENREKINNLFNLGKNVNKNNSINYNDDIDLNSENQNSIEMINKMFNDYSNLKNIDIINSNKFTPDFNSFANDEYVPNFGNKIISQNNNINDKLGFKNIGFNDPRLIYHSPSPLILKKQDSKIIEENKNVDNQIDFDDPKNC